MPDQTTDPTQAPVCILPATDLQRDVTTGFRTEIAGVPRRLIVTRRDGRSAVFLNSCPHQGINLDWREDDFLDADETYLQCAMHGALFDARTGECVAGPCSGQALIPVAFECREDGSVWVSLQTLTELPDSAA